MGLASLKVSPQSEAAEDYSKFQQLRDEVLEILPDKKLVVDVSLSALLSSGHLLLEDSPGVGKTTYIKALAKLLGLPVTRLQFTSDMLPSDILGLEVFNSKTNEFEFHSGPIFTNILIADELNRASPRTQSALLEAMSEGIVSIDRKSYELPSPFIVFASQNPIESTGTYDIPESQLDRFSAKVHLGYPGEKRELDILKVAARNPLAGVPEGVISLESLKNLQLLVDQVHVSDEVALYAKRIIDASRSSHELKIGVSTRAAVSWVRMAKAHALINYQEHVTPDNFQYLAIPCLAHRVIGQPGVDVKSVIEGIVGATEV